MSILIYLIPAALFLGLLGLIAFLWALKSGQFDDMDGAAARILIDDEPRGETRGEPVGGSGGLDQIPIGMPGGVADDGEGHDQPHEKRDDADHGHQGDHPRP